MQDREFHHSLKQLPFYKYLVSTFIISITVIIQFLFWPLLEPAPFILFFPAIIFCCFYGNGTFSIILSAILAQYFFVKPYDRVALVWPNDHFKLLCFLISTFLIEWIVKKQLKAKNQLEGALEQLLEEKSARENFVSSLTHDLQTPLSAIKLSSQLLIRKIDDPEALKKNTDRISHNVNRIEQMVQDILDANKLRAGSHLPLVINEFDLVECVKNVVNDLNLIHHGRLQLISDGKIIGFWSSEAIRRIVENLCNNAIKYGAEDKPVTVKIKDKSNEVEIEVHNEGTPIPPKELDLLFDLYKRSLSAKKSGKKGWGLGLTLVKGLTTSMGGDVTVKSEEKMGTSFIVTLPKDSRTYCQVA